jgi:hypothetical protein
MTRRATRARRFASRTTGLPQWRTANRFDKNKTDTLVLSLVVAEKDGKNLPDLQQYTGTTELASRTILAASRQPKVLTMSNVTRFRQSREWRFARFASPQECNDESALR